MESPSATADKGSEWEAWVGRAILRFGDIEIVSIKLLARVFPEKRFKSICRKRFADRASELIELLEAQRTLSSSQQNLLAGFRQAVTLAPTRNLIAHNPLMLDIYVNRDDTEMYAEHSIRSVHSEERVLDLNALKEFAGEVENLAAEIWLNYCQVAGSSSDLWRLIDAEDSGNEVRQKPGSENN